MKHAGVCSHVTMDVSNAPSVGAQMHRLAWLYIALHDFGRLAPAGGHSPDQPAALRAAVGRLAADAPPIVAAGGGEEDLAKLDAGRASLNLLRV